MYKVVKMGWTTGRKSLSLGGAGWPAMGSGLSSTQPEPVG